MSLPRWKYENCGNNEGKAALLVSEQDAHNAINNNKFSNNININMIVHTAKRTIYRASLVLTKYMCVAEY